MQWNRKRVGNTSGLDTLRVFTTVRYPVLQFNAVKKQFVATRKVSPAASFHEWKSANERNAIR